MTAIFLLLNLFAVGSAFQTAIHHHQPLSVSRQSTSSTRLNAVPFGTCLEIGYNVEVPKPLGIVFGENADPYYGLVVDDISEGLNGGMAGLRVGDQLMAVNGQVVVGDEFDFVMNLMAASSGKLDMVLYRGSVSSLYTILNNRIGEDETVRDDEEGEEAVVMDENYESPVRIEVKERKPLTPGDFLKAAGKVGKMLFEDDTPPEVKAQKKQKKSGFFGMGGDSIQLDGDDANTMK